MARKKKEQTKKELEQFMLNCNPDAEPVITERHYRKFEYIFVPFDNPIDAGEDLNPLGEKGWELVQIDIQHDTEGKSVRVAILKREIL